MIEGLEHRLFLDATFNNSTGLLTVTGTGNADVITISEKNPAIVTLNGKKLGPFNKVIKSLVINGLGGSDNINSALKVPTTVYGGAGNDTVTTGAGNDFLYGNEGNDRLNGNAGDDFLQGGADNDDMTGGAGIDTVDYTDH